MFVTIGNEQLKYAGVLRIISERQNLFQIDYRKPVKKRLRQGDDRTVSRAGESDLEPTDWFDSDWILID